jgi:hypothetical protein
MTQSNGSTSFESLTSQIVAAEDDARATEHVNALTIEAARKRGVKAARSDVRKLTASLSRYAGKDALQCVRLSLSSPVAALAAEGETVSTVTVGAAE